MKRLTIRKRTEYGVACVVVVASILGWRLPAHGDVGMKAPEITGRLWLNAKPTTMSSLRGKVVLVEFWTFGCYNCRNVEPYVKAWHRKYATQGLVVMGVHSPESDFERQAENVERYVREHDLSYAIVTDDDLATWKLYGNHAWPALYLVDKKGVIRYQRVGEGGYEQTEQEIQALLAEREQASGER